ncbi:MAG: hypothetical protein WCI20_03280 [bacterium]
MSLQYRVSDQVLRVDDSRDATEAIVHKYDAFLNLLCANRYAFQRDAIRTAMRFLVSDKYPDLERLARENWNNRDCIRQRHDGGLDAFLDTMPLRDRKAATLDLATGTGKSFVMYGLAASGLAQTAPLEVDRGWITQGRSGHYVSEPPESAYPAAEFRPDVPGSGPGTPANGPDRQGSRTG